MFGVSPFGTLYFGQGPRRLRAVNPAVVTYSTRGYTALLGTPGAAFADLVSLRGVVAGLDGPGALFADLVSPRGVVALIGEVTFETRKVDV